MTKTMRTLAVLTMIAAAGCLSQTAPSTPHYFAPPPPPKPSKAFDGEPLRVRLGRVSSAPYLGERMVVRVSDVELGFDDLHRWAATPDLLVEDALRRLLTHENGFLVSDSIDARVLDVHVGAFEGVRSSNAMVIDLDLTLATRGGGNSDRGNIQVSRPTNLGDPTAMARTAGEALSDASNQVAQWLHRSVK